MNTSILSADEILAKINGRLGEVGAGRKPDTLYAPIRYVLSLGGKRVRPSLLLMAHNLFSDDVEKALPAACGIETYHNYTLLHDDLMDNADMRRGHATVHRKWDANTAILSGDSMLCMAYGLMGECGPGKLAEVMQLFTATALEIGEGQQMDMDFEKRNDVAEEEYIEMIRLKTSVLIACATEVGALLAGAGEEDRRNLYAFGEKLGLAFQLQDDYLDVYGDPKVFGKEIGGDICCNKKTYMLIKAMETASPAQRLVIGGWLAKKEFDRSEKVAAITQVYDELGIGRMAEERISMHFAEARSYIDSVDVPEERKTVIKQYAESMAHRKF